MATGQNYHIQRAAKGVEGPAKMAAPIDAAISSGRRSRGGAAMAGGRSETRDRQMPG